MHEIKAQLIPAIDLLRILRLAAENGDDDEGFSFSVVTVCKVIADHLEAALDAACAPQAS
jgi:hypothetical protein